MLKLKEEKLETELKENSMMKEQLELEVYFRWLGSGCRKNVDLMGGAEIVGKVKVLELP